MNNIPSLARSTLRPRTTLICKRSGPKAHSRCLTTSSPASRAQQLSSRTFRISSPLTSGKHSASTFLAVAAISGSALWYYLEREGIQIQPLGLPVAQADQLSHAELDQTPIHLDPDTKIAFPRTLQPSCTDQDLELVGLGVRAVSFLRVQVYSAGAYFSPESLQRLKGSEKPEAGNGEALVARALDMPYDFAIRIVPTRNTDYSHLRDGFVRAMLARLNMATKAGLVTDDQAESIGLAVNEFKGFFPTGKVPKGKSLLLVRRGRDGALLLQYEGKLLGTLESNFLSKQMMLSYFADNGKEISPKLKTDVLLGLERFM